ncbi:MAG: ATP-binding protein [Promethearchaeota archaeon]
MSEEQEKKFWYKVCRTIISAGQMPFPLTDTLLELIQTLLTKEQAEFILIFKKPSLNIDQIKAKTSLKDDELEQMLNTLMDNGIIVGVPSKSTGIMVYRLLPPFPGIFEYTGFRGEKGPKQKKIAKLFEKLFKEVRDLTQKNYDNIVSQMKNIPAVDRIVPIEKEIEEIPTENIIPYEEISKIIDKFDDIAVAHCYCRHQKDLLGEECKRTNERENCFILGKSAKFVIEHNFGKRISKEEALKIIKKAEDDGLVHKTFHVHLNIERDEEAICNCCPCCCGIFQMYREGIMPYHTITSYRPKIDESKCVGCGTCVEMCPMETIEMIDIVPQIGEERCIGCGVCAYHCPEDAINLIRTGMRDVFIPPIKISK